MKKISIITVCYNEKDVEATCKSVVNQTSKDFEWIVIDGGSSSPCIDTLKKYQPNMDYFVSEKDTGIYNAMNKGIRVATGEYLLFLNAGDCLYDKDVLHDVLPNLTADIVYGNELHIGHKFKHIIRGPFKFNELFFCRQYLLRHQASFIKKTLFDKYGLYDEKYRCASDAKAFIVFIYKQKCSVQYIDRVIDIFNGYAGISATANKLSDHELKEICINLIGKKSCYLAYFNNWMNIHLKKWVIALIPSKKIRHKIREKFREKEGRIDEMSDCYHSHW